MDREQFHFLHLTVLFTQFLAHDSSLIFIECIGDNVVFAAIF